MAGSSQEHRWTDERTERVIALFEERPCLFNTKIKDYSNRDKKGKAYDEIANAMGHVTGKQDFKYCMHIFPCVLVEE